MWTLKKIYFVSMIFIVPLLINSCCPGPWPRCNTKPVPPDEEKRNFTPESITRQCPTHIGGDREFKGHGPDVTVRATLSIRNSNTEVWVNLYLHAKETRSDWTEAEGSWDKKLWTVDSGFKIKRIESDISSNASYRDTDHDLDRPSVRGGSLVDRFEVMGDTGGNDVGNCTDDDVYLNVYFNRIDVIIQPITP